MRKMLLLLALAPVSAYATDTYITITTSYPIADAAGTVVAQGTFCAYATDGNDNPIPFRINGQVQVIKGSACRTITNGTLGSTLQLANPAVTDPQNILYHVTVTNAQTHQATQYPGVAISETGGFPTWDWSSWNPSVGITSIPSNLVVGPQGLPGPSCSSSSPAGTCNLDATALQIAGPISGAKVTIGPQSTPTNWTLDTTSPTTAIDSMIPGLTPDGSNGFAVTGTVAVGQKLQYPDSSTQAAALPTVNAHAYYTADTTHGGADLAAMANAADAAASLTQPSVLTVPTGCQSVWDTVVIDRPITLRDSCFVPQSGGAHGVWGATPTVLTGVTLTLNSSSTGTPTTGSNQFTVPGGCAALPTVPTGTNYAIQLGGVGIPSDAFIVSCSAGVATLSEPAELILTGKANGTTTVGPLNSIRGLSTSNTIGIYNGSQIAISAVPSGGNVVTTASAISANSSNVMSFLVGGTITSTITAEVVAPVILFKWNSSALRNQEGQMVGAGVENVTIQDPAANGSSSPGHTLTGVQGIQVIGFDRWIGLKYTAQGLTGSPLIFGGGGYAQTNDSGNGTVRESYCIACQFRDSGDRATRQSNLVLATPVGTSSTSEDEINQIGIESSQVVFADWAAVHITTHNTWHQSAKNGPRLIFFGGANTQIEGGSHYTASPNAPATDLIQISYGQDFSFANGEINGPDGGNAGVSVLRAATNVNVISSRLINYPQTMTYNVSVTNGSGAITFVSHLSGGVSGQTDFGSAGWNGRYIQITDSTGSCTTSAPCGYWLDPENPETGTTQLNLPSGVTYSGSTSTTATLTVGSGGLFFNFAAPAANGFEAFGNTYPGRIASTTAINLVQFGQTTSDGLFRAGSAFNGFMNYFTYDYPLAAPVTVGASTAVATLTTNSASMQGSTSGVQSSANWYGIAGTPSVSGCSLSSLSGGLTGFGFKAGVTGTCTFTATFSPAAKNGWNCSAHDVTSGASMPFTGYSTTTATFSGSTTTNDQIALSCVAF